MLFNDDYGRVRQPYFIIWDKDKHDGYESEYFVQVDEETDDLTLTGDIDNAFRTYNKEKAFEICDRANEIGMGVKVAIIHIVYKLWNTEVKRAE